MAEVPRATRCLRRKLDQVAHDIAELNRTMHDSDASPG